MLKRQVKFDPISKFAFAIHDNRFYGITLRRSHNIDLYRDLMRVETPVVKAVDVDRASKPATSSLKGGTQCKSRLRTIDIPLPSMTSTSSQTQTSSGGALTT